MAYCTITDLTEALGDDFALRLTDRDGNGSADTSAVNAAIAWADAIIDARLAASHGAPFTGAVGAVVKGLSVDLASWRLVSANPGVTQAPTAAYRTRHDDAMRLLSDLARNREAQLPGVTSQPTGSADADDYVYSAGAGLVWADARDPEAGRVGF
jgi:phage gp36-like protein